MLSTKQSFKHLIAQQQFRFIVKKLFVDRYGSVVLSAFATRTLNVAQLLSTFSTLNTVLQFVAPVAVQSVVASLVVGIENGVPLPAHV